MSVRVAYTPTTQLPPAKGDSDTSGRTPNDVAAPGGALLEVRDLPRHQEPQDDPFGLDRPPCLNPSSNHEPRPGRRHRQRADAGIAEQVERFGPRPKPLAHPGPLRRHVGEESEVAERRALGAEVHSLPAELPAVARHRPVEPPAAAAFLVGAGNELAVRVPGLQRRRPHRLRLGPDEAVAAVALELSAMARIHQAVIGPRLGDQRRKSHAARTAGKPIVARARGPASMRVPTART